MSYGHVVRYVGVMLSMVVFLAPAADAVDRFVDGSDPQCSDVTGTPYCQISSAVGDAVNGDRVVVAAGIYNESIFVTGDLVVQGSGMGQTIVDGGVASTTFQLSGNVVLEHMTITGAGGRGVVTSGTAQIADCEITGNTGVGGGGIQQLDGTLDVLRSIISNNTSDGNVNTSGGGGIWSFDGDLTVTDSFIVDNHNVNVASPGGGVMLRGGDAMFVRTTIAGNTSQNNFGGLGTIGESLTLVDSAVYDNQAVGSPGGVGGLGADITLINSTVSGNQASSTAGVSLGSCCGGRLEIRNSTITGNFSSTATGGVFSGAGSSVSNSIIAGNFGAGGSNDCDGVINSEGYNLIEAVDCTILGDTIGNILAVPPDLKPLADNGGPTWTHLPRRTSPALDAGSPAAVGSDAAACPALDQRGVFRPQDGDGDGTDRCDMGAVELALVFADGFESGDLSRWSQSAP